MWREFKLFWLRLLSPSQCCAMYHHHLRWGGSTCFIPWPGLPAIRGIWGLSGLWEDCCDRAMFELVLIISEVTGGSWCQMVVVVAVSYYYQDRQPARAPNNHLTRRGRRLLSSGHKLQQITTNWCQPTGPAPDCYFFVQNLWLNNYRHSNPLPGLHSISAFLEIKYLTSHLSPQNTC